MAAYDMNEIMDEPDEPTDDELRLCEKEIGDPGQIDISAPAGVTIDDPVQMYLKEIGKIPPLGAEEERKLIGRIADGDEEAKNKLTEANLRLVAGIAKQYVDQGVFFQDLIQEGTLGLMKAVERYDPQRGFTFSTYAAWWIKEAITRTIADQAETVRISDHLAESANQQAEVTQQLRGELRREPTVEEIAARMGVSVGEVQEIQKVSQDAEYLNTSEEAEETDQPQDGTQDISGDEKEEPPENTQQKVLKEQLDAAMTVLTEQEQMVLRMRYGLDDGLERSQEQVGEELGLAPDMVRQIEADAMGKLQRSDTGSGLKGYVDEDSKK